jgi:hypothetical protein
MQRSETGFSFGTQKSFSEIVTPPIDHKGADINGSVKSDSELTASSKLKGSKAKEP